MTSYGQPAPVSDVDPKAVNVNNSVAKRHKLLKIHTQGIFMTRNSMVTSMFKFEHVMTSSTFLSELGFQGSCHVKMCQISKWFYQSKDNTKTQHWYKFQSSDSYFYPTSEHIKFFWYFWSRDHCDVMRGSN